MIQTEAADLVNDFLGSASMFAHAVSQVIERKYWREATGDQLAVAHLKILMFVSRPGLHTIGDVAVFLGVSNAAASKAVDGLVRRALLQRTEGDRDRRTIYLTLTDVGRRIVARYNANVRQRLSAVFRSFVPDELQQAIELLDRLSVQIANRTPQDRFCVQCGIYFRRDCPFKKTQQRQCLYLRRKERAGPEPAGGTGAGAGEAG